MAWLAAGVFALTFIALAARRIGRIPLARGPIALTGGLLMVLVGATTPSGAFAAIDLGTLALLLGMMLLAGALGYAGLFDWIATQLARRAHTERHLVWWTLIGSTVLSGLFLNDTIALMLPPVLITVLHGATLPTFRTLAACAIGVNVGGLWTPVGTPQNAYLATAHGLDFVAFAIHMTPLVVAGVLVAGVLLSFGASPLPIRHDIRPRIPLARMPLITGLTGLGLTLVLFVMSGPLGIPLWMAALGAGTLVLLVVPLGHPEALRPMLRQVNGNLLIMFAGLFMLLDGAQSAGLVQLVFDRLPRGHPDALTETAQITGLTFVLSNLFSNVPAVLLLDAPVTALGGPAYPELLAAASTLAGNTTLLASAATLIVAEAAEAHGERFPFWRFTRIGSVVALVTLALTVPYMWWLGSA